MTLKELFQLHWKRRWWFAGACLGVWMVTAGYALTTERVYEARTKVLLEQKDRTLQALGREMAEKGQLSSMATLGSPLDTQSEVIRSAPVLGRVIAGATLRNPETGRPLTPRAFLERGRVSALRGADILEITVEDSDPARAQAIANLWAREYLEENRQESRREAAEAAGTIQAQLKTTKQELAKAEEALKRFRQEHGAIDLPQEAQTSVLALANLEADLRQTAASHREATTRANALRGRLGMSASEALASTALSQDPMIQRLREQLMSAETDLANQALGANHPEVKQLKARVGYLRAELSKRAGALVGDQHRGRAARAIDPVRQGLTSDLIRAEMDAMAIQTRLEALRSLKSAFDGRLTSLPAKELELTRLQREAEVSGSLYKMLAGKYEEARVQAALSTGNARVLEQAALPTAPARPNVLLLLGLAMIGGTTMGTGSVLLREHLEETLQTLEQAENALPLPTIGVIPFFPHLAGELVTLTWPRSPVSESYRTLRTNLKSTTNGAVRLIGITSAGAGEGKSTTVANLAVTYAQTGKRVLLVDADMRKPMLHAVFDLENRRGLSSILVGEATFEGAVRRGPLLGFDILTAGPSPDDAADLLESEAFDRFLALVREQYDMVLFDAPPAIAVTDASILGAKLEGLVLLVGITRVTTRAAGHALQRLEQAKVHLWGMVVCGLRSDHDPYYHQYYHRYYGEVEARHNRGRKSNKRRAG